MKTCRQEALENPGKKKKGNDSNSLVKLITLIAFIVLILLVIFRTMF